MTTTTIFFLHANTFFVHRKRVEGQIKDIGANLEKKKLEVGEERCCCCCSFVDSFGSWENYRRLFNNTLNRQLNLSALV